MWISEEGRVNTVAVPVEHFPKLVASIERLSGDERERLDVTYESALGSIADDIDATEWDAADESAYVRQPLPDELLTDWDGVISKLLAGERLPNPLRWQLDIFEMVHQGLAEIDG